MKGRSGRRRHRTQWLGDTENKGCRGLQAIANSDHERDGSKTAPERQPTTHRHGPDLSRLASFLPIRHLSQRPWTVQRCLKICTFCSARSGCTTESSSRPGEPRIGLRTNPFVRVRKERIALRVERNAIVMPKLSEAPLPDVRGELQALAIELQRVGIQTLIFERRFHCRRTGHGSPSSSRPPC